MITAIITYYCNVRTTPFRKVIAHGRAILLLPFIMVINKNIVKMLLAFTLASNSPPLLCPSPPPLHHQPS